MRVRRNEENGECEALRGNVRWGLRRRGRMCQGRRGHMGVLVWVKKGGRERGEGVRRRRAYRDMSGR